MSKCFKPEEVPIGEGDYKFARPSQSKDLSIVLQRIRGNPDTLFRLVCGSLQFPLCYPFRKYDLHNLELLLLYIQKSNL